MRIIAGTHRGRMILTPKGTDTRPTQGRIRESIFNIIRNELPGSTVLDLFAGSGALGIEAVSQGALSAVLVDHAKSSQEAILKNICSLRLESQIRFLRCDYMQALSRLRVEKQGFDIVFLDPPYSLADPESLLEHIQQSGVMKPEALWIYEHATRMPPPARLQLLDERTYGETSVAFMKA